MSYPSPLLFFFLLRNQKRSSDSVNAVHSEEKDAQNILNSAISKFGLSHRSIASIKKIGRTIADLNAHEKIEKKDILEALSYRRRK
jgi:magnesium chelatase family protein